MEETKCYCRHTTYCDCGPEILEVPMPVYEKETIEDAAYKYSYGLTNHSFIAGAKWQQERSYSEEEVLHILDTLWDRLDIWYNEGVDTEFNLKEWFNKCELKKK